MVFLRCVPCGAVSGTKYRYSYECVLRLPVERVGFFVCNILTEGMLVTKLSGNAFA